MADQKQTGPGMIIVHFSPVAMSKAQYDDIIRLLKDAGLGAPKGRLSHACYGQADKLRVVDVYDSTTSFEAFGRSLMPLLVKNGIDVGQPVVEEVHGFIPA